MATYNIGDKVRIIDHRGDCWNPSGKMDKWMGKVMTIKRVTGLESYSMVEDAEENDGFGWAWGDEDIAELVEKSTEPVKEDKPAKNTPADLGFLETMMFAAKMAYIQSEFTRSLVELAMEFDVDELETYKIAATTMYKSVDDPLFVEKVLPELIEEIKEDNEE